MIALLLLLFAALGVEELGALEPVPAFPILASPLRIAQPAEAGKPFSAAGERGAVFGQQNGSFEAWDFPIKLLDDFRIMAELENYPVPIDCNTYAAYIEVDPERTTITYSHAAFTIKQHMFVPRGIDSGPPVVFFEIASVRPLNLTFRFFPRMLRMWPAPNFGAPGAEWVARGDSGYYVLHTDNPRLSGAVAMPRASSGILPPYQERPKTYPLELRLRFDPRRDAHTFFPLLMTTGVTPQALERSLEAQNSNLERSYKAARDYYARFFETRLTVETPDPRFNRAMQWAEIAIDQARVRFHDETGLIAGYYSSGDSARPGFGWFFGRDTLWTLYAVHAYGDFDLSRTAMEFLIRRQRADGKMMHEYSQTADLIDWNALPYLYASADATPLFVMAMEDYVNTSGDLTFLRRHWDAVKRAYAFTRAHDSDGDGIYENTEGTGWVEGWPPKMPHQEIYLAALDAQSAGSILRLAALLEDASLAASARRKAAEITAKLETEYYDSSGKFYAFSRNPDGSLDKTATMFPSVAWWDGSIRLAKAGPMLDRWASSEFSTDWGIRDVSPREALYDPMSYHQGSVWPLFTGWTSLAEYRAGRPLSGYAHLMQNAGLTYMQDIGAVTELLSGAYFQPFGRSSSHQTWSSAMVLTPALRGLFGLSWDAPHHTLLVDPHLPSEWDRAALRNVSLGSSRFDLEYRREGDRLAVRATARLPIELCLAQSSVGGPRSCSSGPAREIELSIPLPPVEIGIPHDLPAPGSETRQLKVVRENVTTDSIAFVLEAQGGTTYSLPLRMNRGAYRVTGAKVVANRLEVRFPGGSGYKRMEISFESIPK